jgi:predicted dienelactone hydrolase
MSVNEKIPHMIEWWHQAQSLLVKSNLTKSMIDDLVRQSAMELKSGVRSFVTELIRDKVPLLIFSAGLGSFVRSFVRSFRAFHRGVFV